METDWAVIYSVRSGADSFRAGFSSKPTFDSEASWLINKTEKYSVLQEIIRKIQGGQMDHIEKNKNCELEESANGCS